jgi:two-component system sensor histidine kinase MtrB
MEQMSKVQQRFVADVSHELRTPLTTVRMAADLLHDKRDELAPDDARAVELLQNQLNRFETLLGDLLETSRQDSGAVHLDYEEVDLRALADQVVASLEPLAVEMGCEVRILGAPRMLVLCDALRVERILANLLSNALEHGEGRPVVVEVTQEDDVAILAVTDQGIGLTQEELASVFTRFWRADPSRVRRVGGTGLGLSIALGDARAHGGTLTAAGAPGQGATFTLRLPRVPRAVPVASPGSEGWAR